MHPVQRALHHVQAGLRPAGGEAPQKNESAHLEAGQVNQYRRAQLPERGSHPLQIQQLLHGRQ